MKLRLPYILLGFLILELFVNGLALNGPHIDEAIYFLSGRDVINGNLLSGGYMTWFAGSPFLWPIISTFGYETFGGLFGARLMATLLGMVSLYAFNRFATNITSEKPALWSTLLFALFGPFLHLSHFAVYDNGALVGVTVAAWFITNLSPFRRKPLLLTAGLVMGMGALFKYPIAIMIFPLIGLLIYRGIIYKTRLSGIIAEVAVFVSAFAAIVIAYLIPTWGMGMNEWLSWASSHRDSFGATPLTLAVGFAWFALIPLVLGLLSGVVHIKKWPLYLILAIASFAIWPVYHMMSVNGSANQKHVVLSVLLLYPLAGLLLERLAANKHKAVRLLTTLIVIFAAVYGLIQMSRLDRSWNDSRKGALYLAAISQPGDKILIANAWSTLPYLKDYGKLQDRYDVADLWTVDNIKDFDPCVTVKWVIDLEGSTYTYPPGYMDKLRDCGFVEVFRTPGYITPGDNFSAGYAQDTVLYKNTKFK